LNIFFLFNYFEKGNALHRQFNKISLCLSPSAKEKNRLFVFSKQGKLFKFANRQISQQKLSIDFKKPLIFSQNCPPKRGAKPRARRLIQYGGVCWTMSELSLSKIQRILPIDPPSVSARLMASKTEKFS